MSVNSNPTPPVSLDAFAVGRSSTNAFLTVFETRDPTAYDVNYSIQQRWFNVPLESEWILVAFSISSEVKTAVWELISNHSATTETLTGNSGGAVGVDGSNNINVVGDGTTINISGNPGTHTLTANVVTGNVIVETLTGNSGGAISPSGGNINTVGTGSITIVGSGHTLTTELTGLTNHSLLVGAGTPTITSLGVATNGQLPIGSTGANPVLSTLTAGTGISITNGAGSITVAVAGSVALTFDADTGSATPSADIITIAGGTNITTSATGSTVTINNSIAYATGNFTPGLQFSGSSTGITYSSQNGEYTKIGNIVFYQLSLILTSKGSASGIAQVTGLPIAAAGPNTLSGNPQLANITFADYVNIFSTSGQNFLTLEETTSGSGYTSLTDAAFTNTSSISVGGFYYIG